MIFRRWLGALGIVGLTGLSAPGQTARETPSTPTPARSPGLETVLPLPAVSDYARIHHIELGKISPSIDRPTAVGDLAVLLVALVDGSSQKQWLVEIEVAEITDKERAIKAPPNMVLQVSTGHRLEFKYAPVALTLRTHGPFTEKTTGDGVTIKSIRSLVNAEHLALGFDRACSTLLRIKEHKADPHSTYTFSYASTPFPSEVISKSRAQAAELGVTSDDERALAGSGPALISFFEIAQNAPGLREILWEVVDLPSAWSIVKRGGQVQSYFAFDGGHLQLAETPPDQPSRYVLPVTLLLNDQAALNARFVVTAPRPPLLTTAGIVAIYADHPKKPTRHAILQVMSARLGGPSEANSSVVIQR